MYSITFDDDNIFVTSDNIVRYMPSKVFTDILVDTLNDVRRDTGLLPPGTRQIVNSSSSATYVVEFQESIQPLSVVIPYGINNAVFHVPVALPSMIFVVKLSTGHREINLRDLYVFAFDPPLIQSSDLYCPPIPNINTDLCEICMGSRLGISSITSHEAVSEVIADFFGSKFNSDLSFHLVSILSSLLHFLILDYKMVVNTDTPMGERFLAGYHGTGLDDLLKVLFSPDMVTLFCNMYAETDCDRTYIINSALQQLEKCIVNITCIDDVQGAFKDYYMFPFFMVMSLLRIYPTSTLTQITNYNRLSL